MRRFASIFSTSRMSIVIVSPFYSQQPATKEVVDNFVAGAKATNNIEKKKAEVQDTLAHAQQRMADAQFRAGPQSMKALREVGKLLDEILRAALK